ncbi:MAG: hypothetical protein HYZ50_14415 [Deltaproteobacteria bacterium]|nr:hypothetical protein [Deltaproteobacteria bacterium]
MLRKVLFLAMVGVVVLGLLKVFATPTTEPTWTVRLPQAHGLPLRANSNNGLRGR